ncbi:MAG: EscU/YscU/HrcU family type III secretion system export apparatus switch protein, partial [Pseudomonadota bacterium]|nr:EscU/YscU/HrcU family type III secretion system export apparatus switch protein [Pseudomonadota bacterium]
WGILLYTGRVTFKILITTCWILIVLAILDYMYQRWEYEKGLRMSKQEVKDEYKQTEGNPAVKGRIRRIQREAARRRMMAAVPKADVVITNPTHLAVAVRYDPEKMYAPTVVAKGAGFVAEKIREIAGAHGVPVVENKPVAQLLYKTVDVDRAIPEDLYRAVAEILAYVYGLKEKAV